MGPEGGDGMTALDAAPAAIDQVTGVATLASLDVRTADQWCVCLAYTPSEHAHIVIRPSRVVTGPVEVDVP
jgi:hypothetical protein